MTRQDAASYMATTLEGMGVEAMFLVPTILSRTLYEMEQRTGIKRIVTHGEKSAVYMADGYARASGVPGLCGAQNIGGANLAAGLRDPFLACSPVVAVTGGSFSFSEHRSYYQEIDNKPFFEPVTKFNARIPDAERIPEMLNRAFTLATVGKPGPVHLEFPGHAGEEFESVEIDADPAWAQSWSEHGGRRSTIDPKDVARAIERLRAARRPVVVAGGGVRAAGAAAALIEFAEALGAPIATSLNAKDILPAAHPLNIGVPGQYSRASANEILGEADVVFFVGSQTGSQVTFRWQIPVMGTPIVQLDLDPAALGRHYPDTVGMCGDAKLGLEQLTAALGPVGGAQTAAWQARVRDLRNSWLNENRDLIESDQVPMRPERICNELGKILPDDAFVVADTGHAGMWTAAFLDLKSPAQSYIRAAGSLGWSLPAAIGAQVASPQRQVVAFTGDGGFLYHVSELETAVRWKLPLIVVVNNNHSLNQEVWPYLDAYGGSLHGHHADLWHFEDLDLASVAESFGATGITVRRPGDFAGAFARAVEIGGPVVINAISDIDALAPLAIATARHAS